MIDTIDSYKLNLYCKCLGCAKRNKEGNAHSCEAYPEQNGIPTKVWNEKDAQCKYYETKHS